MAENGFDYSNMSDREILIAIHGRVKSLEDTMPSIASRIAICENRQCPNVSSITTKTLGKLLGIISLIIGIFVGIYELIKNLSTI